MEIIADNYRNNFTGSIGDGGRITTVSGLQPNTQYQIIMIIIYL